MDNNIQIMIINLLTNALYGLRYYCLNANPKSQPVEPLVNNC